jgi:tetratricopeptide (TPR) repeat protein
LEKSLLLSVEVSLFPVNMGKMRYYQYYMLGQCHAGGGAVETAREMFQKSLNLHKDHYKSWEALGLLALREGNFAEAVMNYERAIQAGGRTDSSYANLGLAYGKMGRFKDAEGAFLEALAMNPRRVEALVNLGHLYKKNMEFQKAIGYFQNALEQSPHRFDIRLALSHLYFRSQELERLVEQCDALLAGLSLPRDLTINNFQELSSLYGMIGDTLKGQGRQELSLMAYQDAFLIFPSREIMEKMIPQATSLGILNSCMEEMAQAVRFHGQEVSLPPTN